MNKSSVNEHLKAMIFPDCNEVQITTEHIKHGKDGKDGSYIEHTIVKSFPIVPDGTVIIANEGRHPGKQHACDELINYAMQHPESKTRVLSLYAVIKEEIKLEEQEEELRRK